MTSMAMFTKGQSRSAAVSYRQCDRNFVKTSQFTPGSINQLGNGHVSMWGPPNWWALGNAI